MKANFPNQRATKTMNMTVAMTTPTIPMRAVTDTSVLGGLKCEGKAAWKGENKMVKSKVRKKNVLIQGMGRRGSSSRNCSPLQKNLRYTFLSSFLNVCLQP